MIVPLSLHAGISDGRCFGRVEMTMSYLIAYLFGFATLPAFNLLRKLNADAREIEEEIDAKRSKSHVPG